jgi:hypothetical protein
MWHAWERNVYRVLMGKPEGKTPLGRPRRRWEDGIRMDLRETGWGECRWDPVYDLKQSGDTGKDILRSFYIFLYIFCYFSQRVLVRIFQQIYCTNLLPSFGRYDDHSLRCWRAFYRIPSPPSPNATRSPLPSEACCCLPTRGRVTRSLTASYLLQTSRHVTDLITLTGLVHRMNTNAVHTLLTCQTMEKKLIICLGFRGFPLSLLEEVPKL